MRTCELAGFGSAAQIDRDLVEWDYGEYEGRLAVDILAEHPGWQLFRDGCPGGESPLQVAARADRVVERVRSVQAMFCFFPVVTFSACWPPAGWVWKPLTPDLLMLGTASLSALGYEHSLSQPAIWLWNDTHHVLTANEKEGVCEPRQLATNEVTR